MLRPRRAVLHDVRVRGRGAGGGRRHRGAGACAALTCRNVR
jgi:hypothetical protein